jgi:PAS domain S-box-containing protein
MKRHNNILHLVFHSAVCLISIAIFIIDIIEPKEAAVWIIYSVIILISFSSRYDKFPVYIVSLCTMFIILGYFLSPSTNGREIIVINRFISILVIWSIAYILRQKRTSDISRKANEHKYQLLLQNSLDAILLTAPDGTIYDANDAACSMFCMSKEEICRVGRNGIVDPTDPKLQVLLKERRLKGKIMGELTFIRKDGSKFPTEVSSTIYNDDYGNERTSMIIRDISRHKEYEELLKRNETNLQLFIDNTVNIMWAIDDEFRLIIGNKIFFDRMASGLGHEVKIGDNILDDLPESLRNDWRGFYNRSLQGVSFSIQTNTINPLDFRIMNYNFNPIKNENNKIVGVTVLGADITELRRTENELQKLIERLNSSEESIRKKTAQQLHDEVGQNLTALDINLNYLNNRHEKINPGNFHQRLEDSISLLNDTIEHIRNITTELRPSVLDNYGLNAAIKWKLGKISERSGINYEYIGNDNIKRLPIHIEYIIFRIVQEALHNIEKHSQAKNVSVILCENEEKITIKIADNGLGFAAAELRSDDYREHNSLGIIDMYERTNHIGGKLEIKSAPGQGTTVTLEIKK